VPRNGPARTPEQKLRDRVVIADRYERGWPQWRIAEEVGRDPTTVSEDLRALRAEYRKAAADKIGELIGRELAKLDRLEREAWRGWRRSLRDAEKKYARVTDGPKGPVKESAKTTEGQAGDAKFLLVIQKCVAERAKIVGLYASERRAAETAGQGGERAKPITIIEVRRPALSPAPVVVEGEFLGSQ
jgi:hypothetical protein